MIGCSIEFTILHQRTCSPKDVLWARVTKSGRPWAFCMGQPGHLPFQFRRISIPIRFPVPSPQNYLIMSFADSFGAGLPSRDNLLSL